MPNIELFVDNLTVIDCSVLSAEHGISGESWICDIVLAGALDSQSMVMDFGLVKKHIKQAIDEAVDHRLLVPLESASLTSYTSDDAHVALTWTDGSGQQISLNCPPQGVCTLPITTITAQAVAEWLPSVIYSVVEQTIEQITIYLRPEVINGPSYHYSHGLKKHDGNCQRIAHGHRSKLEIWRNNDLATDIIRQWAEQWNHIYVGSSEDMAARLNKGGREYLRFAYDAPQGRFELELAADRCVLIDSDSTVECIAHYIATQLAASEPKSTFLVKAYEGVGKGAMAKI
jgi:6-pyruvoyl-tetrahydropterin synthase